MIKPEQEARVREELKRYEHPLFDFAVEAVEGGVRVTINLRPEVGVSAHEYRFLIPDRELAARSFAWDFQRQLFNYLHDYLVEMFTRTPQTL
jgi:hypothetical protein